MKLTQEEHNIILNAEKSIKKAKVTQILLFLLLIILFTAMIAGILATDIYAYLSIAIVYFAAFSPNIGGPSYDDVVKLLIKISSDAEIETPQKTDPLIEALLKK